MVDENRLAQIAQQLAARVRDDDPEANGRWLLAELPDPADWWRLLFVQAAAMPVDREWRQLTAWFDPDPCGTRSGVWQHRKNREPLCSACRAWEAADHRHRRANARKDAA